MTQLIRGVAPLLISLPHIGTNIPESLKPLYQDRALGLEDTDWFLDSLYDFAQELGASLLVPQISRYVIDLNRPPDNTPMYPGASNTELCPTRFFSGEPLYKENCAPSPEQIVVRRTEFWEPYHRELQTELSRLKQLHPHVLLWDGHSIRSQIPWLFEGKLPDFNFGTADGKSADPALLQAALNSCRTITQQSQYPLSTVANGRFKGGYITRQYGDPTHGIHAIQLEMCQSLYMNESAPWQLNEERAKPLRQALRQLLTDTLRALRSLPSL